MQTVSQLYKTMMSGQHRVEVRVRIDRDDYPGGYWYLQGDTNTFILNVLHGELQIGSGSIENGQLNLLQGAISDGTVSLETGEGALFEVTSMGGLYSSQAFTIGSCVSREIEVKFILGNAKIPRMAEIRPEVRLVDDAGNVSEWIPKGTFWLDTREYDKKSGVMTIRGYDAMLKGEATYIASGTVGDWPKTMSSVASEIAGLMGLTMDSRNNLNTSYLMQLPTGYSMREILGYIATANGGNWIVTDEGKLRLIRVNDVVDNANLGLSAMTYHIGEPYQAFSKVEINLNENLYVESGDDTGRTLVVDCPIVTTTTGEAIADALLAALDGFIYTPLTVDGAILDPAMEIGDLITVGSTTSVLATQTMRIDSLCASDISAPGEDELDHEYPYESVGQRKIERKISNIETTFRIETNAIIGRVEDLGENSVATVVVQYALSTSSSVAPSSGWSTTAPTWEAGKYMWQRTVTTYADNTPQNPHVSISSPTCIQGAKGQDGTSGSNGYNTALVYLYKRSTTVPTIDWTNALTYNFSTKALTATPSGWSATFPTGDAPLYVTVATAYGQGTTDTIPYTEWVAPVLFVENGEDGQPGANGSNGLNVATVFLYKRGTTAPAKPNGNVTYTFTSGAVSGSLNGWSRIIPTTDGNPCYVIQATASNTAATDTIGTSEWSSPAVLVEDGTDGVGITSVTVTYGSSPSPSTIPSSWQTTIPSVSDGEYLWTRTVIDYTDPNKEDTVTYTYAKQGENGENGQAGTSVTVSSIKYQQGNSATTAPTGTWSNAVVSVDPGKYLWTKTTFSDGSSAYGVARQGVNGNDGATGYSTAIVYLYKRSATTISAIDWSNSLTYNFTNKALTSVPSGWSESVPSGTNPLYVTTATAYSNTGTDTIAASEWSTPVVLAKNGAAGTNGTNGIDGLNVATVFLYQRSATVPDKPNQSLTYDFISASIQTATILHGELQLGFGGVENGLLDLSQGVISGGVLSIEAESNWTPFIPDSDGNPCYVIQATASSRSDSVAILASNWSSPVILVEDGVGISAIITEYLLVTGSGTPTGNEPGWTTTPPAWDSGKFIWTRSHIYWDDGTETYTTPECNNTVTDFGQKYSEVKQTADKISWLVASGTSSSNFVMTDRAISQVTQSLSLVATNGQTSSSLVLKSGNTTLDSVSITFTGVITAASLTSSGTTQIDGSRITTGQISADRIDVANLKAQKVYYENNVILTGETDASYAQVTLGIASGVTYTSAKYYGRRQTFVDDAYNTSGAYITLWLRPESGNPYVVLDDVDIYMTEGKKLYLSAKSYLYVNNEHLYYARWTGTNYSLTQLDIN